MGMKMAYRVKLEELVIYRNQIGTYAGGIEIFPIKLVDFRVGDKSNSGTPYEKDLRQFLQIWQRQRDRHETFPLFSVSVFDGSIFILYDHPISGEDGELHLELDKNTSIEFKIERGGAEAPDVYGVEYDTVASGDSDCHTVVYWARDNSMMRQITFQKDGFALIEEGPLPRELSDY